MSKRKFSAREKMDLVEVIEMISSYPFITSIKSGSDSCLVFYTNTDAVSLGNMLGNMAIDLLSDPDAVGFNYECRAD